MAKKSKIQQNTNVQSLPNSLWKFYVQCVFPGYRWIIFFWMMAFFIISLDQILFPNYLKWVISLLENGVPDGLGWVEYISPTIILIIVLNMTMTLSGVLHQMLFAKWSVRMQNKISEILTQYEQSQSLSFWTGRMPGKITQQMIYIQDIPAVIRILWRGVCMILMLIINVVLLFSVNIYVASLFFASFIFRAIYAWYMRKPLKDATEKQADANSTLSGKLVDSLSNYSIVKSFAGAEREKKYLDVPRQNRITAFLHSQFITRCFWSVPSLLWDILFGGTLFFCAMLYLHGEMTIAEIVFSVSIFHHVMMAISVIIDLIPDAIDKIGAANHAYKELVVPIDVTDSENAIDLIVKHGKIEFKNVYFKYKNKYVLRDFCLTVNPGERVGIVGASGAGKTTLVNLLMRFYDASRGDIFIDGNNIRNITQSSLHKNISFIPQEPMMFNRTIGENIAYGKDGATMSDIKRAAKFASADKFINGCEKKYESLVGDRGIKLSGGQRQRIAIARAFLKDAPILILDEATSALDSETEMAIQKSFDELSRGRTTIAIAHRLSTLRNMDRIIVLDAGHVVESGTHNSLLRKKGVYEKLWKLQSGGFMK